MAFEYRKQIELQLGVTLPTEEENENMDPAVAAKVAQMAAQAAQRLLQQNQAEAAQQQAQAAAQDPVIQMQQQEMALKEKEANARIEQGNRKITIEEKRLQMEAVDRADKTDIAQDKAGADLLLAMRKQVSAEELGERRLEVDAFRAGVMGRSADAAVLQRDREQAIQMVQALKAENQTNKTGESGMPEGAQ
jgi:predicted membrane-bound mannosyltransferase